MPQISTHEFERLPLRVHDFLAGVPLHDVWAIDLPRARSGITLDEFLRKASKRSQEHCDCCENDRGRKGTLLTRSPVVRALLSIRFFGGRPAALVGIVSPPQLRGKTFATRPGQLQIAQSPLRQRARAMDISASCTASKTSNSSS